MVRYPFARGIDGRARLVAEVDGPVVCFGCGAPMRPRRGEMRQWHFAHVTAVECGESALHGMAKALIAEGLRGARYPLAWTCGCGISRMVNVAAIATEVLVEHGGVKGTRSDVWVEGPRRFAVEVVVTNEIAPETLARYEEAGVPVVIVRPTFESVVALRERLHADEVLFAARERCAGCAAMAPKPLVEWIEDASGNAMSATVRRTVHGYARRLIQLGFRQSNRKPHIFVLDHAGRPVYASLGGAPTIPLMHDARPHLSPGDPDVVALLTRSGIPVRTSSALPQSPASRARNY